VADYQIDSNFCRLANETLDQMAKIKLSPTQYRILFVVWRFTYGFNRLEHELSLSFISKATGCDKRQLQREVKGLVDRKIIFQNIVNGVSRTLSFNDDHGTWIGKTTIGETDNGEIDNGELDNGKTDDGSFADGGETDNPSIGEIDNARDGETDNQEIQSLKTSLNTVVVLDDQAVYQMSIQIENHFCQRKGKGLQVNIEDEKIIHEMIREGLPVDFIKSSIDKSFKEFKPKHSRDEIRSFSFCAPKCYDDWARHLERSKSIQRGGAPPASVGQMDLLRSDAPTEKRSLTSQFTKDK
jgi:phage replication O-like protein O